MNDGIKDGLIGDPRQCRFDPATVACTAGHGERGTCLTPEQVTAARKLYAGPHDSKGRAIGHYGGVMPGSELNWIGDYIDGPNRKAQYRGFIADVWRYLGFNPSPGPAWTLNDLDFDRDPARLEINEALYRADNPDFRGFDAAGGKFIGYQGWSDTSVVPSGTIDFYETVVRTIGGLDRTKSFFRFYAVPGIAPLLVGRRRGGQYRLPHRARELGRAGSGSRPADRHQLRLARGPVCRADLAAPGRSDPLHPAGLPLSRARDLVGDGRCRRSRDVAAGDACPG